MPEVSQDRGAAVSCKAPCHALFNDYALQWRQNLTSKKQPSCYFKQKMLKFEASSSNSRAL